jgi:peroxiredoxin
MANILTGDFDVVAEFALPAINRVLAAMHQCERFPHSVSLRVDDNPPPGRRLPTPVVTSVLDTFGDPIANHRQIGGLFGISAAATAGARRGPGGIVNPIGGGVFTQPPIEPSHIQGRAQLQLFPPTVDVPDASGVNLSVTMNLMARYFPDANSAPLADFIRGDLRITAPVNQITSQVGNVVEFDFNADQAHVNFTPSYTNKTLSADDIAGIDLLVQNALRTSLLPSSANLPDSISSVQFKALQGGQKALAVLLNQSDHGSNWNSVSNVFLNAGDDFAFAAGSDFVLATLQAVVDSILSQDLSGSGITLKSASFAVQPGKIVLTVNGHANTPVGGTDFTATLDFSLQAVGPSVNLIPGGVSLGNLSNPIVAIGNWITGDGTQAVRNARDQALSSSGAALTVSNTFDVNSSLGKFLNTLLNPDFGNGPPQNQSIFLTYTGVDIQPAGITARGSLWLLFQWPAPYVEFEQIPSTAPGRPPIGGQIGTLGSGPDYSAFNSWIPGGRIDQYEWSVSVNNQLYPFGVDPDKFVLLSSGTTLTQASARVAPPGETGGSLPPYQPLCLTVQGTRLSSQGPVVPQAVSGSVCAYTTTPLMPAGMAVQSGALTAAPMLALTRPGPSGQVVVTGYASAQPGGPGAPNPNLIMHFGDGHSTAELQVITRALQHSKRHHSPTVVIAVLPSAQLGKAPFTDGVIYADDRNGVWESQFGLQNARRPLTVIVDPKGTVTWKHEGTLKEEALAAALSKVLVDTHNVPVNLAGVNVRIGHPAPDFLFEYAPGRELTLSKLNGRPVVLVFWRSSIEPSIQAVLDLQKGAGNNGKSKTVVLAVNDGESPGAARAVAAESGFTATVVTDPEREISLAYGIDLWPTIVAIDASGDIAGIRYGYLAGEHARPVVQTTTASR